MFVKTVICYNREKIYSFPVIWDQKWDIILFVISVIVITEFEIMYVKYVLYAPANG